MQNNATIVEVSKCICAGELPRKLGTFCMTEISLVLSLLLIFVMSRIATACGRRASRKGQIDGEPFPN